LKTLVTGATGFIGTHLVKALVEEGRDVKCLVRKTSNTKFLEGLGVEFFYGDLRIKDSLKGIIKDVNIVYHLAGEIYSKRSRDFYRINLDGTKNLVEVGLSENIDKFIFLSSIAAVGPNREHDILLNEQSLCSPINPYGRSKLEAEKLLTKFFEKYEFPAIIIRAPIIYGPSKQSNIITKILHMIYKNRFLIMGDGKNLRSLCYIDNLFQGLTRVEESSNSIGGIYFVSDEKPYTFNEIFQTIAQQLGTSLKETHLPNCIGKACGLACKLLATIGFYSSSLNTIWNMVLDMACDISKAKRELNYNPRVSI
jgi:nucleoside-diphosphate-sugar epimerase